MKQGNGRRKTIVALGVLLAVAVSAAEGSPAQNPPHAYPAMAPLSPREIQGLATALRKVVMHLEGLGNPGRSTSGPVRPA